MAFAKNAPLIPTLGFPHQNLLIFGEALMITGIQISDISLKDLYELLERDGLPRLIDNNLRVFRLSDIELSGMIHVFAALPENYMWASSLSHLVYNRQYPRPHEVDLRIEEGNYQIAAKKLYKRSNITQKRAIRGLLHPKVDPFLVKATRSLPMGAELCATFLNMEDASRFLLAMNSAIADFKDFLVFPVNLGSSEDGINWLYILQEHWARHGDGGTRDRSSALRYANDEIRMILNLPPESRPSLYHQLDHQVIFNYCSMVISWGGDSGINAAENDLLWERVHLQAKLINFLEWPIFYPYVAQHINSEGDPFENLERWAALAPSDATDADEVIGLMYRYLSRCERSYASLRSP